MIHNLKLNNQTPTGKRIVNKLRMNLSEVDFGTSTVNDATPEGYLTGEEFFSGIKKELKKRCQDNGLL
jgi:hypothetical protein